MSSRTKPAGGTIHDLPDDLAEALGREPEVVGIWESLTPLARNEFICWVTSPRKEETRIRRISRTVEQLQEGKRRPCCWQGCPHHNPKLAKYHRPAGASADS